MTGKKEKQQLMITEGQLKRLMSLVQTLLYWFAGLILRNPWKNHENRYLMAYLLYFRKQMQPV